MLLGPCRTPNQSSQEPSLDVKLRIQNQWCTSGFDKVFAAGHHLSPAAAPGRRGGRGRRAMCGAAAQPWRRGKAQLSPCQSMQVPGLAAGRDRGMRRQADNLLLAASSSSFSGAATRSVCRDTVGRARKGTAWLQEETRTKGRSR